MKARFRRPALVLVALLSLASAVRGQPRWDDGAQPLPGGWKWLRWFGAYNDQQLPWIYHPHHGFLYSAPDASGGVWFYGNDPGWMWTKATVHPAFYRSYSGSWLWYLGGSHNPRLFFDFTAGAWMPFDGRISPAVDLRGTWDTPFAVNVYGYCRRHGDVRVNRRQLRWVITGANAADLNVDWQAIEGPYTTLQICGDILGAPIVFPMNTTGVVSGSRLTLYTGTPPTLKKIGEFTVTSRNIKGMYDNDPSRYDLPERTRPWTLILTR